ncbi:9091_t:CDS:2 [Entrophospora sp. SA101]|nr:9091_t:CDS:2 [Entrophospora sp. SA101]
MKSETIYIKKYIIMKSKQVLSAKINTHFYQQLKSQIGKGKISEFVERTRTEKLAQKEQDRLERKMGVLNEKQLKQLAIGLHAVLELNCGMDSSKLHIIKFLASARINIKDLSLSFGHKILFDNLNFCWQNGDKITIVGDNGSGKSTLINLLAGKDYGQSGQINTCGKIGYLPQSFENFKNQSTLDHLIYASQSSQLIKLAEIPFKKRSDAWFQEFNSLGGNPLLKTFYKFGFTKEYFEREFFELSGGEKVKVHLSGLAHADTDILLLDEPTNHLDNKGCDWIENFIRRHQGIAIMVTHDRALINNTGSKIAELCPFTHKLIRFRGGHKFYLEQQKQNQERSQALLEKQEKNIAVLRKKQDALGYAASLQVKKKIKRLKKDMVDVSQARKIPHIVFNEKIKTNVNLSVINLAKHPLFAGISFNLGFQDRLVITGKNGAGKTTLFEIICGLREPDNGSISLSKNAAVGFLDQEQKYLDLEKTPIELIQGRSKIFSTQGAIIGHLKQFGLYYEHDFFSPLKDLSIGCRRKAQLAQMIAEGVDVLLLDEPTNHLDLMSLEQIENQLLSFPGLVIAVSHDRYFIKKIADKILHLEITTR